MNSQPPLASLTGFRGGWVILKEGNRLRKENKLSWLIDQVGVAHRQMQISETKYRGLRKSLAATIMDGVGKDVWIKGEKFKACMLRDKEIKIDPFDFLKEVKSYNLRQKILRVSIGQARTNLTLATFRRIVKRRYTEPRLNILEIKSENKRRK
ncbi:MAG TPA: hypothetical protein ENI13_01570 [candidate division CPR3 bacterium]|uniref:Uncharacterized protein n=1 Tax=candidate division CPR3 bacterium TaxID=2268181 RepID=A0A7C1NPQ7_UNCC3|nr:hypothetical protein [candidate division CPR3 bacterium]